VSPAPLLFTFYRQFSPLNASALAEAVSRWRVTAEERVRSQLSPFEIRSGETDTGTGFCPSTSVFPRHYHSSNAACSSLFTYCCYQKEKRAKPGNIPKSRYFFLNLGALAGKAKGVTGRIKTRDVGTATLQD
jgi:hypothetical protein